MLMTKPNIVFILSDQHKADVMGCAGDEHVNTPNIDQLAEHGTMLENHYCNSPLCAPSRSSMLSGVLPAENGVSNNMQSLRSDQATFAHSLSVAGYETVLSGRMHFVGPDQRHGFEKRLVGDITPSFYGMDNEEQVYGSLKRTSNQNKIGIEKAGPGNSAVLDFDKDVTQAACEHLENREDTRPLFMTVGLYGPHSPYICPEDLYHYYYEKLPIPEEITDEFRESVHPAIQEWYNQRDLNDITVEQVRKVRAAYYGMVTHIDNLVGEVVNKVEETIGLENTIIIYGSDHGDNIGHHGLFWKTNFYEASVRAPLIFSWKDVIPEGQKIDGLTSLLDLAPTLIEVSGGPELPLMQGESLVPYLKNEQNIHENRVVISQLADIKGDKPSAMIRKGPYKLVLHYSYRHPQLFRLDTDPMEENDLACLEEYSEVREELEKELLKHWDPEKAYHDLQQSLSHFQIIKQWGQITNVEPVEEWRGDVKQNYLLKESKE